LVSISRSELRAKDDGRAIELDRLVSEIFDRDQPWLGCWTRLLGAACELPDCQDGEDQDPEEHKGPHDLG
jgi:hypothetical protein